MEWRCEWCGKPHEENAPPCENCGHGRFERTTVPVTELDGPEQLEWVCTACGRSHPRNAPPCSRCGNTTLERQQLDYDDLEVGSTGYLDLATPRYLLAAGAVVAFAALLVLGSVGVVDLPGLGQPTVSDVPGHADAAANLSLGEVEAELVAAVNDRRRAAGHDGLATDGSLADAAEYLNQRYVKAAYADGARPDGRGVLDEFGVRCRGRVALALYTVAPNGSPAALDAYSAAGLAGEFVPADATDGPQFAANATRVGADVHVAPDDVVYATVLVCQE